MSIKFGGTRIVLLFKDFVIKIPRIHILYPIKYFLFKDYYRRNTKKCLELNSLQDIIRYIFCGFLSNRLEFKFSLENPDHPLIVKSLGLFFGLLIIQKRGNTISKKDKKLTFLFSKFKKFGCTNDDLFEWCNFCFLYNKPMLVDYGNIETIIFLNNNKNLFL